MKKKKEKKKKRKKKMRKKMMRKKLLTIIQRIKMNVLDQYNILLFFNKIFMIYYYINTTKE